MPAVRSLFSLALPKVFGTTKNATNSSTYNPNSSFKPASSGTTNNNNHHRGPNSSAKISVKQEWSVLRADERYRRSDSDVELLDLGKEEEEEEKGAFGGAEKGMTRKLTLSKHAGEWRGIDSPEAREGEYKAAAFGREQELLR